MYNPKIDLQLNQSLNAAMEEREKSLDLNVGYNKAERAWDLIIKFSGDAKTLKPYVMGLTELLNGYGVVRIEQDKIDAFANLPQIEYVEKPKRLFFASYQAQAVSCINVIKEAPYNLTGKGILVACVDSGIDYRHMDFRNPDGTTRLVAVWDQTVPGNPPEGYFLGTEYTKEQIDAALLPTESMYESADKTMLPEELFLNSTFLSDYSGHGTAVMGIAAGNGRESGGVYEGVAPQSDLLVVKLGSPLPDSFPKTTECIQAIDYCIRKAMEREQPMALNISFGSSYGSREGNSLLESYLNQVVNLGRTVICVGMGNEGNAAGHTSVNLRSIRPSASRVFPSVTRVSPSARRISPSAGQIFPSVGRISPSVARLSSSVERSADSLAVQEIEFAVGTYQTAFNMQIWKNYVDDVVFELESSSGERVAFEECQTCRYVIGDSNLLFYRGLPSPYSAAQELYLDFIPRGNYVESGRWILRIHSVNIVDGSIDLYLPGGNVLNEDTRFLTPSPEHTLTIPSAAEGVISVGAYDSRLGGYAGFSGRGYTRRTIQVKPDVAAPGVDITTAKSGGGYESVTGTSFAAPFVTGAAALLMEWGIGDGNDPYLYGEKVKAYLQKGAKELPGVSQWPNNQMGYGVLCVRESLPIE